MAVAVRQISITLEEDLLQFLDQWRDQQWQRSLAEVSAALDEADALIAACEAAELARGSS